VVVDVPTLNDSVRVSLLGTPKKHLITWARGRGVFAAIPIGVLAVSFWLQDAVDPLTAPALLLDRAFQVVTLALIPAGLIVLFAAKRLAVYAISFIGVVGCAMGVAVALSGVIRPPHDPRAVALAIVAFAAGGWILVEFARRIPELQSVRSRALTASVATVIPLLQFWNGAAFLPSRTEATLTQAVGVKVVAVTEKYARVVLDYEAINPTDARVAVIVTRLTICWWGDRETAVYNDKRLLGRGNCSFYRPIGGESVVSPSSRVRNSAFYSIPIDRPHVTVISRIAFARGDRLRTSDDVITRERQGPCRDVRAVRLEEESRLKSLAQPAKYLVYADRDGDGGLNYWFDSGPDIECPGRDRAKLARYLGATDQRQVMNFWLAPPKK
jgi:hypothetical protein